MTASQRDDLHELFRILAELLEQDHAPAAERSRAARAAGYRAWRARTAA
jgi:hypothetical protein